MTFRRLFQVVCRAGLWFALVFSVLLLVFAVVPVPYSSFMLGHQIDAWFSDRNHSPVQSWIPLNQINTSLPLAVVAGEDQHFFDHHGIDWAATKNAITAFRAGQRRGGGSTITQQLVKNLFLWEKRSVMRKGFEWLLALYIECFWSKKRILEVYLNLAQFSDQHYGVAQTCQAFFKKDCDKITARQAALMVSVLPNPWERKLSRPSTIMKKRQRHILKQMRQLGGEKFLHSKGITQDRMTLSK